MQRQVNSSTKFKDVIESTVWNDWWKLFLLWPFLELKHFDRLLPKWASRSAIRYSIAFTNQREADISQ